MYVCLSTWVYTQHMHAGVLGGVSTHTEEFGDARRGLWNCYYWRLWPSMPVLRTKSRSCARAVRGPLGAEPSQRFALEALIPLSLIPIKYVSTWSIHHQDILLEQSLPSFFFLSHLLDIIASFISFHCHKKPYNLEEKRVTQFTIPDCSLSSQGSHSGKEWRELVTLPCRQKKRTTTTKKKKMHAQQLSAYIWDRSITDSPTFIRESSHLS